jgi:hypothetical protein
MEKCENCGRTIGNLEPAHLWNQRIVCNECIARLRPATPLIVPPPLPPTPPASWPIVKHAPSQKSMWNKPIGCLPMLAILLLSCVIFGNLVGENKAPTNAPPVRTPPVPQVQPAADKSDSEILRDAANNDPVLPGISPPDVYLNFGEAQNFTLKREIGSIINSWTCTNETADRTWRVAAQGPKKSVKLISSVTATSLNMTGSTSDTPVIAEWLVVRLASLPYTGAQSRAAQAWVKTNLQVLGVHKTAFGGVKFELFVRERAVILTIRP